MLLSVMTWQTLGFDLNKKFFERGLQNGGLSHAYLFTGQEMIGKKTFALELAKMANELPEDFANNPDLLFIQEKENISIDQARKLKSFLSLKPYSGRYKVAIIDDCHLMNQEAANAILKVLEEPPAHSLIIMVTANPKLLLPTIYSRCQEIKFNPLPRNQLLKYLNDLGLNQAQAEFLADFSNGRLGLAYQLKESNSFKEIKKTLEAFNKIFRSNLNDRLSFAEKVLQKDDGSLLPMLLYWMFYLRSSLSKNLKINRAQTLKNIMETRYILSKPQYNHRLAFENLLINL